MVLVPCNTVQFIYALCHSTSTCSLRLSCLVWAFLQKRIAHPACNKNPLPQVWLHLKPRHLPYSKVHDSELRPHGVFISTTGHLWDLPTTTTPVQGLVSTWSKFIDVLGRILGSERWYHGSTLASSSCNGLSLCCLLEQTWLDVVLYSEAKSRRSQRERHDLRRFNYTFGGV